jgi:hypothetical protein
MSAESMHFVTVGATQILVENLWERIAAAGGFRFSHIVHPELHPAAWEREAAPRNVHFFCHHGNPEMPEPDRPLLASLERDEVPTLHNMILSDRVVSTLDYREALAYSTFLARRLVSLYEELRPTAVIGAFDALHGSLALAVARKMNIPWFALNFSVIPPGFACFCDRMSPAARVNIDAVSQGDMAAVAAASLEKFENRKIEAPAYLAPPPRALTAKIAHLPQRVSALLRTVRKARRRQFLKFVEYPSGHDVWSALRHFRRTATARSALAGSEAVNTPPSTPYALFGLHVQPESSIDVWAPFFSNQLWVIELLARSIPPTHRLLVKIHKSDAANYSREHLDRMRSFPGVKLVAPFADTRQLIEKAALVFSIQGTIGLEAALLGKPVIALGESPIVLFPSASPIGKITDLPMLVRRKLAERPPSRLEILEAYRKFLEPFAPAGHNDWTVRPDDREIEGFAGLFAALGRHLGMSRLTSIATSASRLQESRR